ncbi:MAG: CxxxxCH/CxxCH domain-containing protein [Acidobacteria bacterium]|nr:CxxxxCH/CxxCH domain-containing protein [Acidobacteriota bacterium]
MGCSSTAAERTTLAGGGGTGGVHPAGWLNVHAGQALKAIEYCKQCHEMSSLRQGSGVPSCQASDCHHRSTPGWQTPGLHGLRAKEAFTASGGSLVSCQLCHGTDFRGGGAGVSCASCHSVQAPHPHKPWRGTGLTHATVDPSNAPVCAQCHFPGSGANPANHPPTPAPAGASPSCFNNTMCHGANVAPHPLGSLWKDPTSLAFHGFEAKKDLLYCQSCHGTPGTTKFDGGSASTACSSCHKQAGAHSLPWYADPVQAFPGYVPSHRDALKQESACAACHDFTKGRTPPNPASPSCFSASRNSVGCHANGPGQANHPIPFTGTAHTGADQAAFNANCRSCHATSGASPLPAAPLCSTCHQSGSPLTTPNCASCHGRPPAGSSFPNVAGVHAKHDALSEVAGTCATCHDKSDSGTLVHYDHANGRPGRDGLRTPPAPVGFPGTFDAKAGKGTFDPATLTCSNVSCHGGIKTPSWQGGSINSAADAGCRQCHTLGTSAGVPESNSPYSGNHALHLGSKVNALCTDCHAMGNGSAGARNHFKFMGTPQMEGPSKDTVWPMGNAAYYNATTQSCGTFTCHEHLHSNVPWTGGASHAVPYLGTGHFDATPSAFDATCKTCHGVSGASPIAAAPTCSACHQASSPLTATNCTSCHSRPPGGTTFPDAAGRHPKHNGLPELANACGGCHASSDSGTLVHYDHANGRPGKDALRVPPAPVQIPSIYNAKGGPASFDPSTLTCSSVSCHGAIKTPNWTTGSIDSSADAGCRSCHSLGTAQGAPEANSLYSGLHALHLGTGVKALCTECHAMGNGSVGAGNHFKFMGTSKMEGPASDTVWPMGNASYYNATNQTCGTFTCHGELHNGNSWTGGANHAIPYLDPAHTGVNAGGFDSNCKNCHGLSGSSPLAAAPTCSACHKAASPLTAVNCTSCHGRPPAGSAFPDVAGKHARHNALPELANACAPCHSGTDSGSQVHYDHANGRPGKDALRVPPGEVSFLSSFNAKSGPASFNPSALTCSSVSCHGGVLAPSWTTGSISSNTDAGCRQCHVLGTAQGVPQYNSPYSGGHALHLGAGVNALCTECHSMANGTVGANNHFRFMGTTAMEGPASDTVWPLGTASYYRAANQTCGTFTCHGQVHTDFPWKEGANHAVPYLASAHTTVNQANFDANCRTCHGVSGSSPMTLAPTCSACHQKSSPLAVTNCASCHAKPPTGTVFPEIAGTHAVHNGFPGVTGTCGACHQGSDSGTQIHYDHANGRPGKDALRVGPGEVAFLSAYNAKSGSASFNPSTLTCATVSCHGGQTTPNWRSGSIDVNTQCAACHSIGTSQYNSFNSGEHRLHAVDKGYPCSDCHSMTNGTPGANNHFAFLGTSAMEGPAADTITFSAAVTGARTYNRNTRQCTLTCHNQNHNPETW